MNRVLIASIIVGIAVMMSVSAIGPAYAKQIECIQRPNGTIFCKGGIPEGGDPVTIIFINLGECTFTVISVSEFDDHPNDRDGRMNLNKVSGSCISVGIPVRIIGPI